MGRCKNTGAPAFLLSEGHMTIGAEQRAVQVWDDDGGRPPLDSGSKPCGSAAQRVTKAFVGAGKTAARLTRRYPLQILAGALALGFVVRRVWR